MKSTPVPLLATKLYVPPARADAVPRPRLAGKLLAGVERPRSFTLLSGPAGSGKTTLLSEFVARLDRRVAWLSLDGRHLYTCRPALAAGTLPRP